MQGTFFVLYKAHTFLFTDCLLMHIVDIYRALFLKRLCYDALQRYQHPLRTSARKDALQVFDFLTATPAFQINMEADKSMRMFLSVGAMELCPVLLKVFHEPQLCAASKGINSKMVALFVANWLLHMPLISETIAVPETLMLSINMLTKVSNVCLILVNLFLLMEHSGTAQDMLNVDKEKETKALALLDFGLQYCMYEWDGTFLERVFGQKEGLGVVDSWKTSPYWVCYNRKVAKRDQRGIKALLTSFSVVGTEMTGSSHCTLEMENVSEAVVGKVCQDVVKILLGKMLLGKDAVSACEVQTIENNNLLRRIHSVCPGLVEILVDKHLGVMTKWFHVHMNVYWPFYVATAMTAVE